MDYQCGGGFILRWVHRQLSWLSVKQAALLMGWQHLCHFGKSSAQDWGLLSQEHLGHFFSLLYFNINLHVI